MKLSDPNVKQKVNYAIDAGMLIAFLACGLTGLAKMPQFALPIPLELYGAVSFLHDWSGIASVALIIVHFVLHAKWFGTMTARLAGLGRYRVARNQKNAGLAQPMKGLTAKKPSLKKRGMAVSALALAAALSLMSPNASLSAGGMRGSANVSVPTGIDYSGKSLRDGTYTGTATGFQPGMVVEVSVKGGKISAVKVTESNDTPRWLNAVLSVLPGRVVKANSTDVDTVTGATFSSEGLLSAVENALQKAVK
jgi:uncharacterized protein with FMN-binding domain